MKWGIRRYQPYPDGKKKGKFVPKKRQATAKRQISADKKTLENIEKGGRARAAVTKKRQAKMNEADKKQLTDRISKNEARVEKRKQPKVKNVKYKKPKLTKVQRRHRGSIVANTIVKNFAIQSLSGIGNLVAYKAGRSDIGLIISSVGSFGIGYNTVKGAREFVGVGKTARTVAQNKANREAEKAQR